MDGKEVASLRKLVAVGTERLEAFFFKCTTKKDGEKYPSLSRKVTLEQLLSEEFFTFA